MLFRCDHARMSRLPLLLTVAAFSLVTVATFVHAQVGDPPASPNLFVAVDIPGWQDPLDSTGPAALRSRPIWVEFQLLDALDAKALPAPLVQFNLFDDVSVAVRISISSMGIQATGGGSFSPGISGDGRFIAFASDATNLVPNDLGGFTDVFFRDRGPMRIGDLNGDGVVDDTDVDILKQNWGDCPCCATDLDGDGSVGILDLLILLTNWG